MRVVGRLLRSLNARSRRHLTTVELEDLAQDVLLIVWKKLSSYQGDASLETWVYRIAAYELLNAKRRRERVRTTSWDPDLAATEESATEESPADAADGPLSLLRHLGPREAEVVRMRHVDGLKLREVATVLGISTSSVKTHYYRALTNLKRLLPADVGGNA